MGISNFNAIKSLSELRTFVEKAAEEGFVQAGWFGKKVCVGQQSVSERKIWDTFARLEKALVAGSTEENDVITKNTALCERALRKICSKKTDTPWYIKIFRIGCFFLADNPSTEKDFDKINNLRLGSVSEKVTFDRQKSTRIINFVTAFGEEFPNVFEAFKELRFDEPSIQKLAQTIVNEVPLQQLYSVYCCCRECFHVQLDVFDKEVNKELGAHFSQKTIGCFPSEVRENWKGLFECAKFYSMIESIIGVTTVERHIFPRGTILHIAEEDYDKINPQSEIENIKNQRPITAEVKLVESQIHGARKERPYKIEEVVSLPSEEALKQLFQTTDSLKTLFLTLESLKYFSPTVSASSSEQVCIDIGFLKYFFTELIKKKLPHLESNIPSST